MRLSVALTELGYGNNAVEMETTAEYDVDKQEFIIHTPSTLAQKFVLAIAACILCIKDLKAVYFI